MKKLRLVPLLAILTVGSLAACAQGSTNGAAYDIKTGDSYELKVNKNLDFSKVKVGLICLHDKNSTYDKNFIDSMEEARVALGLKEEQVLVRTGINEDGTCLETAREMANNGCNVIFADSFGHEDYMIQAAKLFPNVQFHHATGTKAHTEKLANYHNGFASIYEGRYLAGVVAGLKLKDMKAKDASVASKVGYIGAFTYAEVISGYTSWYLGVKSVVEDVTMDVTFTGSWYNETLEKNAAINLIKNKGCVLVSQHADSLGAPTACEQNGIPNVSYNGSTEESAPKTYLCNSRINWAPYFVKMVESVSGGAAMAYDTTGNRADGSVLLSDLGKKASTSDTAAYVNNVKKQLENGSLKVFDTSKFTVTVIPASGNDFGKNTNATVDANKHLTSYKADVDDFGDYVGETEVVANGEFQESKFRSAPYFDIQIDGINLLDTNFGD